MKKLPSFSSAAEELRHLPLNSMLFITRNIFTVVFKMISKIFRVLFSFNKKFFTMTVLSVILAGVYFWSRLQS